MIVKELDLTGKSLSNYKIIGKLGKGGMATVYKAHELSLTRVVALKVLSPRLSEDTEFIKRFQREARAAAQLNHPNIVQIYAIGEEKGVHYFAMEYIKGKSLAQIKKEEGMLAPGKAAAIIKQVAEALGEAHKTGLVHRDIKPSNIMIDGMGRAKVADFGIAYVSQAQTKLTREGSIIGTPEYISPEQCEGKTVDQRSDIYSLGVTLYEVLTGKTPYEADTPVSMLMKIVKGDFPPVHEVNPNVPVPLREIVEKMMQTDPGKRYANTDELLEALLHLEMGELPVQKETKKETIPLPLEYEGIESGLGQHTGKKSNKWAAVIVAAIIVILMGGAFAAKTLYFDKKSSAKQEEKSVELQPLGVISSLGETGEEAGQEEGEAIDGTGDKVNVKSAESPELESFTEFQPGDREFPASTSKSEATFDSGDIDITPKTSAPSTVGPSTPTSTISSGSQTPRKQVAPVKPPPPANSCIISAVGDEGQADLVTPYVQEILARKNFMVVDGPSVADREIAEVARNHIVVTVKQTGTTTLDYYGKSSEMYTVRLTIKVVAPKTGKVVGGPVSRTVEYTALNAEEKLKAAVAALIFRLQPALEAAKEF